MRTIESLRKSGEGRAADERVHDRERLRRARDGGVLRRVRHERGVRRQGRRRRSPRSSAARCPIYEPGLDAMVARNMRQGRLRFTTDTAEAIRSSLVLFIAVQTPPQDDGSTDLTAVGAGGARDRPRAWTATRSWSPRARCPSARPTACASSIGGGAARARARRSASRGLEPRVPARGRRDRRLHAPRPRGDRRRRRRGARDHEGPVPPAVPERDALRAHQHPDRGAHQVRRQRVPRHQDLLHQRVREPLRAGRRRRPGPRARHRPRRAHRAQVPARRPGLRRLVLPEGHALRGAFRARARASPSRSSRR